MKTTMIQEQDQQYILQTYARYPIALVKGQGAKVWDADGKEYLDFLSGIAVNPLGHCHPDVINAIVTQAQQLMHTSNLYYTKPAVELAKLLVTHGGLDKVFFCNSGAEANEAAIKLARKYQSRQGQSNKYQIIAAQHSFHGRTYGSLAATDKQPIREGFGPLPEGFQFIEFNNVEALKNAVNENTAAILLEPIQGEGGIYPATHAFLQAARELCDQFNAVLIFDEIQCGLGRIGTLFAYQSYQIKPDIITLAKGIANGLPLGAICVTDKIAAGFQAGDHATTFGGNPVATAAAAATINTILTQDYLRHIQELDQYFSIKLLQLKNQYPALIKQTRGKGLMIGIELTIDAKKVLTYCHDHGLLVNITGNNVLRLLPPYVITKEDVDAALAIIAAALLATTLQ